jgi:DNA-binding LacI/PurR family transcriptional regulator
MNQRITLKQVAARAGVSYQTVSKVLNHQASVTKATEERIWNAAETLGYQPNLLARSLRTQHSRMIGYSWAPAPPDLGNPILDQLLQSMAQAATGAGYHLLTFPYRNGKRILEGYGQLIDTNQVDGFVISSVEFNDARILYLKERGFPFVAFGRSNPEWDFPYVDVDGAAGMRMVVEHLTSMGHRRIYALAWPENSRVGKNRMEGYLEGLHAAGIEPPVSWMVRGDGNFSFGFHTTSRWLELPADQRPTAIVGFNDLMAIGAMNAIQQAGWRVGDDIAVTGFDNMPLTQYLVPPLTTVRQPIWEIGEQLIAVLLSSLTKTPSGDARAILTPRLLVRESSDPSSIVMQNI